MTAQSVASYAFITTKINSPSSTTLRAYSLNNNKKLFTLPWHHQRLLQQQNVMSTSSLYDSTNNQSPSDDREKISNENIFFIEVGFGNDSHGQVHFYRITFSHIMRIFFM